MRVRRRSVFALVLMMALAAAPAGADIVVDQQQSSIDTSYPPLEIGGTQNIRLAQTFTVGVAGIPTAVELPIQCESGMLIVEIVDLAGDIPAGASSLDRGVMLAADLPPADPPVFREIPLEELPPAPGDRFALGSPSFHADPGQRLAMVISNPTGRCWISRGVAVDPYLGGHGFFEDVFIARVWMRMGGAIPPSDDLPFRTIMDADPESPACEIRGVPPTPYIPRWAPVCRCLRDESLREFRCAFFDPSFFLVRRVPFPIAPGDTFTIKFTLIPLTELPGDIELKDALPQGFVPMLRKPLVFRVQQFKPDREVSLEYQAVAFGVKDGSYATNTVINSLGGKFKAYELRTWTGVRSPK